MVCPTCGLDNDPSAVACARCNTALTAAPAPSYQPPPPYRQPSRSRLPLIAGLAVALLIALVVGIVLYRDGQEGPTVADSPLTTVDATTPVTEAPTPQEPEPTETAADPLPQAQAIDALLDRSRSSRNKLNSAIDRVGRCTGLSGALADMRAVGEERRAQISEVRGADLTALANGETLRSTLATALQHSLDADAAFVEWAEAAGSSCPNTAARRADYARGLSTSKRAGTAKQSFLDAWNPVATGLGLPARDRDGI